MRMSSLLTQPSQECKRDCYDANVQSNFIRLLRNGLISMIRLNVMQVPQITEDRAAQATYREKETSRANMPSGNTVGPFDEHISHKMRITLLSYWHPFWIGLIAYYYASEIDCSITYRL